MDLIRTLGIGCLLLLASGFWGSSLSAQQPEGVEIQGRVIDNVTGEPVPGATVVALDSYGDRMARRITDQAGEFSLLVQHRAAVRLRAGRLGYQDVTTPFLHFEGRDFFVVQLLLDVDAVLLAPLEVVAHGTRLFRSPTFSEFDLRARSGFGSYFTRADIERIQPGRVTDLLQQIPGVHLQSRGRGARRTVSMGRTTMGPGGGGCPVQIFVDGRLITRAGAGEISVDDLVVPQAVEGIEVYRGLSTVPPEFLNPDARCGVIGIWTRRGG